MLTKFKRGDIVEYDCSGERGMARHRALNGSIGILTGVKMKHEKIKKWFWEVRWIFKTTPYLPVDALHKETILRKVGHTRLPRQAKRAANVAQEGDIVEYTSDKKAYGGH